MIDVFLPHERIIRHRKIRGQHATRATEALEPLFPNYLFADCDAPALVRSCRGVIDLVKITGTPLSIPDVVIAQLRKMADPDGCVRAEDVTKLSYGFAGRPGDWVCFRRGTAWYGMMGQIQSLADLDVTGRIQLIVNMLGTERSVPMPFSLINRVVDRDSLEAA